MNKVSFFIPKKLNFGSFLILLIEIKYLVNHLNFKNIIFILSKKNINKNTYIFYKDLLHDLDLGFGNKFIKYKDIYKDQINLIDYTLLLKKNNTYSFQNINNFYSLTKIRPRIDYKKKIILKINRYLLKNNIRKFITIHLKHDPKNNIAHANYRNWAKALKKFKFQNNLLIFFVGNNSAFRYLNLNNDQYIFCEKIFSISEQMYLVNKSKYFIGMASGFCCAANFSDVPHIIIKHPEHHKDIIKNELVDNKIPFSKKNQKILFLDQKVDNIVKLLNNLNSYI